MIKTITGIDIPEEVLGVLYICKYTYPDEENEAKLEVLDTRFYASPYEALEAFASTRNPESQVAYGHDKETFEKRLTLLHKMMVNQDWLNELSKFL